MKIVITKPNGQLRTLNEIESEVIQLAIEYYGGHMIDVARHLGIGRSTLYRKTKERAADYR